MAHFYLIFFFPELLTHSFLHPIHIYLRVQGITHLVTLVSLLGTLLHFPSTYIIVTCLSHGIVGVAATSNISILLFLLLHVNPHYAAPTHDCLFDWKPLLCLDLPQVEVVRDHDRLVWPPRSPHRHCCFHEDSHSDHFSHLRIFLFARFHGFDSHGNELGANCPSCARLSAPEDVHTIAYQSAHCERPSGLTIQQMWRELIGQ
ncbi:hypothetical protein Fmac_008320 [Flemingia macrophylla]|uniref:Uncharacterized protein n=1 Tax=Flemingia macrophylla TaxID=520843 RepID=A0ABD1MX20_9FABA